MAPATKAQLATTLTPPSQASEPASPPPSIAELQQPAIDPNTKVTPENVDAAEALLRQHGFFGKSAPDETSDWFSLFVQVLDVRGELAPTGMAARKPSRTIEMVGHIRPIALMPEIELHSRNAVLMFRGRQADASTGKARIPAFYQAADRLWKAMNLSQAGNPYADWHLVAVGAYLAQAEQRLVERRNELESLRVEREQLVGMQMPWPINQAVRPADRVSLRSAYSVRLLGNLSITDQVITRLIALHQMGAIGNARDYRAEIQEITRTWRTIVHFIVQGWDNFLSRDGVRDLRRETVRQDAFPAGYERFCANHFKRNDFPESVWTGARLPLHK